MHIRRVVVGEKSKRAVIVSDEKIAPIEVALMPGGAFHRIWGADEPSRLPTGGEAPRARDWFPPHNGFRFAFVTLAPEGPLPAGLSIDAAIAELETRLPGMARTLEPDAPGMHTTDTVDFSVVLSGQAVLEVDDGKEVVLGVGDCVVQNGTRHRWRNRGSVPCVMAVAIVGAARGAGP